MKRIIALILAVLLFIASFAGCDTAPASDSFNIVCTVYPVYDWLNRICGDTVKIKMLGANGTDIHNYQPTAADIAAIASADLTVVIGGLSDEWVGETARQNGKGDEFSLLESVKSDLLLAGGEHNHEGEHPDREYDEHVWLSPKMAAAICTDLCKKVVALDPKNAEKYNSNLDEYLTELSLLDGEYKLTLGGSADKTVVIADRYPFRYLMNDYGLDCHAAYDGCSAETSADFSIVTRLAKVVIEHSLTSVMIIDGSSDELAKSVITASGRTECEILTLDSMQSTTAAKLHSTEGYIGIMKANLAVIKSALER